MKIINLFLMIMVVLSMSNFGFGQLSLPKNWKAEVPSSSSLTKMMYHGYPVFRFELNKQDKLVNGGKRAEISTQEEIMNVERWYSISICLPNEYILDSIPEIVAQWHAVPDFGKGESWRSPPISLFIKNNHWWLNIRWAVDSVNTNKTITGSTNFDLGICQTSKWIDWLFHIKFSYKNNGFIELWKNGKKVYTHKGANYYNDEKGPYFKFGIYKWMWNKPKAIKDTITKRVLYFRNVQILNTAPDK